jgi:hypothetical protein
MHRDLLFRHFAAVADLALDSLVSERVIVDALVNLFLILGQLAQKRGHVQARLAGRVKDRIGQPRVVARSA